MSKDYHVSPAGYIPKEWVVTPLRNIELIETIGKEKARDKRDETEGAEKWNLSVRNTY